MKSGFSTIWYFLWRGTGYGILLGALAGTFVYPIIATFVAGMWGGGVGLVMGLLLGIGVHFYNRHAMHQQVEFEAYQNNLVFGAGLATALVTALPLFLFFAPVAGLAAAYVTHRYAEDHASSIAKRKNESLQLDAQSHMERPGVISKVTETTVSKSKWLIGLAVIAALVLNLVDIASSPFRDFSLFEVLVPSISLGIAVVLGSVIVSGAVGLANGIMIQFLNRVYFKSDISGQAYKRRVMAFAAIFSLLISPVVTLGIGAPLMALIAALAAGTYADWLFADTEKQKRHARRNWLEEEFADGTSLDEYVYEEDEASEIMWR